MRELLLLHREISEAQKRAKYEEDPDGVKFAKTIESQANLGEATAASPTPSRPPSPPAD